MRTFAGWHSWAEAEQALAASLPADVLENLGEAYRFAAERHGDQTRPAGEPYVEHLLQVVQALVEGAGERAPELLTAALLHDVVEDTPTTMTEVGDTFGADVAELVSWVTQPAAGPNTAVSRAAYLDRLHSAPPAVQKLKLADRMSNVQRLDTHPRPDRQRAYYLETCTHFVPLAAGFPWFSEWYGEWRTRYAWLASAR